MKTILDYKKYLQENNKPFLAITGEKPQFMTEYNTNYDTIFRSVDNYYLMLNNDRQIIIDDFSEIDDFVKSILQVNKYKFDKLYKTMLLDYNPIWNVDGTEITTTEYGEHVTNFDKGGYTDTTKEYTNPYDTVENMETAKTEYTKNDSMDINTSLQHTDTVTNLRQGNIGVTSTQNLINQERDVADFNFWETVYQTVINNISYCIGV